jgi:hypothetical protein
MAPLRAAARAAMDCVFVLFLAKANSYSIFKKWQKKSGRASSLIEFISEALPPTGNHNFEYIPLQ